MSGSHHPYCSESSVEAAHQDFAKRQSKVSEETNGISSPQSAWFVDKTPEPFQAKTADPERCSVELSCVIGE